MLPSGFLYFRQATIGAAVWQAPLANPQPFRIWRAGPSIPQSTSPDPAHARLSGLLDGEADAGRDRGDGDAGQGTGVCRAQGGHAGAASLCTTDLRPCGLRRTKPSGSAPLIRQCNRFILSAVAEQIRVGTILRRNGWESEQERIAGTPDKIRRYRRKES